MAGSIFGYNAKQSSRRNWSEVPSGGRRANRRVGVTAAVILSSAAIAFAMIPFATAASAAGVPTVTAVSPTSGSSSGGTKVTIAGTNFTGATKVAFGPVAAASFAVVSSTKITAFSPAEVDGTKNILVTTPGGTSAAVAADQYTYVG